MIGAPPVHVLQSSFSKDAVLTTTYQDDYITRGMGFQVKRRISLTSGQTLYLEFNIALHTGVVYSLPIELSTAGGLVLVDTYSADPSTAGSVLATPLNLNGLSPIVADTTARTGVTSVGAPSNLREYIVGTASTNQSSGGGQVQENVPKILNNTRSLYFKLVNQENAVTILNFGFIWFELPPF